MEEESTGREESPRKGLVDDRFILLTELTDVKSLLIIKVISSLTQKYTSIMLRYCFMLFPY
jgi:hypothetical protein